MAARAIWAGTLKIGSSSLPVKLYPAVQDKSVHFHILDAKNKSRVKQHMVNPCTGEEVAKERRVANPGWLRFAPGGTAAVIMVWDIGTYELMEGNYYKGYLHF
jgi:hypothetical protein